MLAYTAAILVLHIIITNCCYNSAINLYMIIQYCKINAAYFQTELNTHVQMMIGQICKYTR